MDGYNQADLIQLIGQATVELAYLRKRIADLEAAQAKTQEPDKPAPNGTVIEVPARA